MPRAKAEALSRLSALDTAALLMRGAVEAVGGATAAYVLCGKALPARTLLLLVTNASALLAAEAAE